MVKEEPTVAELEAIRATSFFGWYLIGLYPDGDPGDVGAWILHCNGEAMLLEVPEGLRVEHVGEALKATDSRLKYITASHVHYDHLDEEVWFNLGRKYGRAPYCVQPIIPGEVNQPRTVYLGSEPVYIIPCPKHSVCDIITIFRGVAMTGDIELGTLDSVTKEVPMKRRKQSFENAARFFDDMDYQVHTVISAHVNDIRTNVDWPKLFRAES